jgi:hypothetical protein
MGAGPLGQFLSDQPELGAVELGRLPPPAGAGQAPRPLRLPVGVPAAHALTAHVSYQATSGWDWPGEQPPGLFAAFSRPAKPPPGAVPRPPPGTQQHSHTSKYLEPVRQVAADPSF